MFCFINPSQLHQIPAEMERHSAVLADGQANIQNNNQQISATSLPFPSPLPPPLSLLYPLSVFIDFMYTNIGAVYAEMC